jgi:hypothetical protein
LHCGLNTEQQVAEEEDVIWDWTKLFTEVVSSITSRELETNKKNELSIGEELANSSKMIVSDVKTPRNTARNRSSQNKKETFDFDNNF